jgi:hypothetical protein
MIVTDQYFKKLQISSIIAMKNQFSIQIFTGHVTKTTVFHNFI